MSSHQKSNQFALALAALGVVYGDIGTSPLYAFKEAFAHGMAVNEANVLASLSAFFWAILLIVSLKYVGFILRFDNQGEGGVLALMALAKQTAEQNHKGLKTVIALGIFAAGLFYADSFITPAISVLSAVEGINVVSKSFEAYVVPMTIIIIVGLFAIQRHGTQRIGGLLFGPIMIVWFATLGGLGLVSILKYPKILLALNPYYALDFVITQPNLAFILLSAVFLALTGGEALFADMGHFGAKPVRMAWYGVVWPGLVLNYFGQGALVLRDPQAVENPFYLLAPEWGLLFLVVLATFATVIASQATIAGAYSMTLQAARLNLLPRVNVMHTSDTEQGQIYMPFVNGLMLIGVVLLVLGFGSSSALAAAYGLAVSGTMLITTGMVLYLLRKTQLKMRGVMLVAFTLFAVLEIGFVASNASKLAHGGWLPLSLGILFFIILHTWQRGQAYLAKERTDNSLPMDTFLKMPMDSIAQVEGTAVYLASDLSVVPSALMHNLKHYKVLHTTNVFLVVKSLNVPYVQPSERVRVQTVADKMYTVEIAFGFREQPLIVPVLHSIQYEGLSFDDMNTTYFTSNSKLVDGVGRFNRWQFGVFNTMYKQAASANDYFGLPPNRTVQLGAQVAL
ncbi:MAG: potassium transporter Kup [Burkholderiales bacterium]|nr:potassium transporter Kup [Burkholderiales bacterium]